MRQRNIDIYNLYDNGKTQKEIAESYNMSTRQVRRILNDEEFKQEIERQLASSKYVDTNVKQYAVYENGDYLDSADDLNELKDKLGLSSGVLFWANEMLQKTDEVVKGKYTFRRSKNLKEDKFKEDYNEMKRKVGVYDEAFKYIMETSTDDKFKRELQNILKKL